MRETIDDVIGEVLRNDLCSGCGACVHIDAGLAMVLDEHGYQRPARASATSAAVGAVAEFRRICPGLRVDRPPAAAGARRHPLAGNYLSAWSARAADPDIAFNGASGGTLTALLDWLARQGIFGLASRADPADPRVTVAHRLSAVREVGSTAGSRYAPVSVAGHPDVLSCPVVVGKPCEVSAIRQLAAVRGVAPPLLLSFYCAGTPSQHATSTLLARLGLTGRAIDSLWYRGHGWPGRFTAVTAGKRDSLSYTQSWGEVLGRQLQWRCKVCPDGVGEHADVTAADLWDAGEDGYPVFTEQEGTSALIVRTRQGQDLVDAAVASGALTLSPIDIRQLVAVQPFQATRREAFAGRWLGSRIAGRAAPRARRLGLWPLGLRRPIYSLRMARGAAGRIRKEA